MATTLNAAKPPRTALIHAAPLVTFCFWGIGGAILRRVPATWQLQTSGDSMFIVLILRNAPDEKVPQPVTLMRLTGALTPARRLGTRLDFLCLLYKGFELTS